MVSAFQNRAKVAGVCFALLIFSLFLTAYTSRHQEVGLLGTRFVTQALSPMEVFNAVVAGRFSSFLDRYVLIVGANEENRQFKERLANIEEQGASLIEMQKESQRLKRLLEMQEDNNFQGIAARVIGHDPSNWVEGITIDRGALDGVVEGQPVVEGRGVVGQVTAVAPHSAKVLLITDHSSGVDAIIQSSRLPGVVEGLGQKKCSLKYILGGEDIRVGERVITSGQDGVYPKGLLIGKVSGLKGESDGMFQSVEVKPTVDIGKLEEVFVILASPPSQRLPGDQPLREEYVRGKEH